MSREPMWRNPNYPADRPSEAPRETGQRLCALRRSKREGPDEELRVTLDEFEGHPFVSVRVWALDSRSGQAFPTRKGCSVRISEAPAVIEALRRAVELAEGGAEGPGAARAAQPRKGQRRPDRRQWEAPGPTPPLPMGDARPFDEFAEG